MNLVEYMRSGWASATAFFGVNLTDTSSKAIKGPAGEPENWRRLGTDDVRQALTEQHWTPVDPGTMLPSNLPLPLQAGGPGSGRHQEGRSGLVSRRNELRSQMNRDYFKHQAAGGKQSWDQFSMNHPAWKEYSGIHEKLGKMRAYGTSEGAGKGWDTRGRGHRQDAINEARGHGYTVLRSAHQGTRVYEHPETGHRVLINQQGQWSHRMRGEKTYARGTGGQSLSNHLESIHKLTKDGWR